MKLIKIEAYPNGGHANQTVELNFIPEGWAVIPEDMETPNFPFGEIETEVIKDVMTVTKWTSLDIPEAEPTAEPITLDERVSALESAVLELALGGTE